MKKLLAAVMASTIAVSPTAFAATSVSKDVDMSVEVVAPYNTAMQTSNEPTTAELEQMIKIVKPKLDVPEECTEFDWNYNAATYYNAATWRMTWFSKDYSKEVSVNCDNKGNITYYSVYENGRNYNIELPKYTKAELEKTANEFLARLAPEAASHMKLESSSANGLYNKAYNYNYVRYENGIKVPDNTASVSVDYITGKPTSMSIGYNHYVSFDGEKLIDEEGAKKSLKEAQEMKLSYKLKTEYDDDGNRTGRKAYLVYTPSVSYLSVDAKNGKVYTERNTWTVNLKAPSAGGGSNGIFGSMNDAVMKEESAESEYRLSEEELAQLEVLENLITREEAIKAVVENKYLYIDSEATAIEAQLRQVYNYDYYVPANENKDRDNDKYQWDITFTAPYKAASENGYFRPYMYATVDAQTGAIISFNASLPGYDYYEITEKTSEMPELTVTKEKAGEIFTEFANTVVSDYVKNTRLSDVTDSHVYKYITENENSVPLYRAASVNLVRVNEDVDFTYNNVDGVVDLVTGKITHFSYNWYDDVVFESPKDAITPEEAYDALLNSDGFGLNYEINSNYTYNKYLEDEKNGYIDYDKLYTTEQYTRLVYSGYNYLSTTVSALTGKLLDYSGEEAVRNGETVYTDIAGHWAEADIKTLLDLGFAYEGTEFKPDSFITYGDYEKLMQFFNKYVNESVPEDVDRNAHFTRTDAVKYIIDSAGYYKIASMPDIFITDFADNSELKREDVGFIAIARGFGLVQGNLGEFRPYDNITRAEAVTLILNFTETFN